MAVKLLLLHAMKTIQFAFLAAVLGSPLPVVTVALHAQNEQHYRDADHNDEHVWNKQEDTVYRRWVKENHRRYEEFSRLNAEDQRAYWRWRHEHEDHDRDHHDDHH